MRALTVVAIIPARGGSQGISGKNLKRVGGIPLITRAVQAARAATLIDQVIVTTDDAAIAEAARLAGAEIIDRPSRLAGDLASSEDALLHVLSQLHPTPEVVVFLQATSPFIDPADLDHAIARVSRDEYDVVFSAVATHEFLWRLDNGEAQGVNHDSSVRPLRQEREPHYRETGAFYVLRTDRFREAEHRFFGRVGLHEVSELGAMEIDTPQELELAAAIAPLLDATAGGIDVDAVVTDFDGVHTDDRVLIAADGNEYVLTNRGDGMGVELLRKAGIPVLILSTEKNPVVAARARKLNVEVIHGVSDKAAALTDWATQHGVPLERIAYLGNDINDLGCLELVGWPVCVPGAKPAVTAASRTVLDTPGGFGAVRELAERVLAGRNSNNQEET